MRKNLQGVFLPSPAGRRKALYASCLVLAGMLCYTFVLAPRQALSWQQQVQLALDTAHRIDADAVVFLAHVFIDDYAQVDPALDIEFHFASVSGSLFRVRVQEQFTLFGAQASTLRTGTPPQDVVRKGPVWFRTTLADIQIGPAHARQRALTEWYTYSGSPSPNNLQVMSLEMGTDVEARYGVPAVWQVGFMLSNSRSAEPSPFAFAVVINAQTGDVIRTKELYNQQDR